MKRTEGLRGAQPCLASHFNLHTSSLVPLFAVLLCAGGARAQAALPSPATQFDVTGFIQAATVDPTMCPSQPDPFLKGGTVTVNGIKMVVPCNTIIQMPANTIPWALLFPQTDPTGTTIIGSAATPIGPVGGLTTVALNGQPIGQAPGQTGLALADSVNPLTGLPTTTGPFPSFEIRAVGNVVKVPDATGILHDTYIVGLVVPVSQQGANIGSGTITCIDYANGFLVVGGDPNAAAGLAPCTLASGAPNGSRVQINDPVGRWGNAHSPDPRFQGDTQNTTVHSQSGYPMCVPRVAPTSVGVGDGGDPLCPAGNRPVNGDPRIDPLTGKLLFPVDNFLPLGAPLRIFDMPAPPTPIEVTPAVAATPGTCTALNTPAGCIPATPFIPAIPAAPPAYPDSRFMVPFMVGDYIDYQGSVAKDALGNQYISAHTVIDHIGVFTAPGTLPAYVAVETILLGTGGTPAPGISIEPTTRIFIVGFTTDPTNLIDINAVDVNPCSGVETLRRLGTVDPRTQVLRGRFRFHVLGGKFMPPTREMVIRSHDGQTQATPPFDPLQPGQIVGVANGLGSGQYRLPNFDFIVPENLVFGQPIVSSNFQDMPFLAQGSGPLFGAAGNSIVGQLIPWPGDVAPPTVTCTTVGGITGASPIVSAGFNFAINTSSSGVEPIFGSLTEDPNADPLVNPLATPPVILWTQTSGPAVTLSGANTMSPTFSVVDPVTLVAAPSVGAALGAGATLGFSVTVTDIFGTATSSMTVTVLPTTDTVAGTAVWRAPRPGVRKAVNKVGTKGGLVQISGVGASTTGLPLPTTLQMIAPGWGNMEISPVVGFPTFIIKVTGVDAPPFATVRTSLGAEALNIPVRLR